MSDTSGAADDAGQPSVADPCAQSETFDVSVPTEAEKAACQPDPFPVDPTPSAFDGGVAGACETYSYGGSRVVGQVSQTFDAQGHLLTSTSRDADGGVVGTTNNIYDACGAAIWTKTTAPGGDVVLRHHLNDHGLVSRIDRMQGADCTATSFVYEYDDQGRAISVAPPDNPDSKQVLTYGADGRVASMSFAQTQEQHTYSWFDGGGLKEDDSITPAFGYFNDMTFDEQGHLLRSHGTGDATSELFEDLAAYRADGQLLSSSHDSNTSGCSGQSWQMQNTYSGAVLVHQDFSQQGPGCSAKGISIATDYTYPEPNVQVATNSVANVETHQYRTAFDSHGNALSVDLVQPGGDLLPQQRQSFDGCGAISP